MMSWSLLFTTMTLVSPLLESRFRVGTTSKPSGFVTLMGCSSTMHGDGSVRCYVLLEDVTRAQMRIPGGIFMVVLV